jgi:hypothetical protein
VHRDGGVDTQTWTFTFNADGSADGTETATYAHGGRLTRSFHAPPYSDDPDHLGSSQTGTFTLASGEVLDFKAWIYGLHDVLQVDGHEGWTYNLTVPKLLALATPDTSRAGTGSLTRGTQVTSFALPANPGGERWQSLSLAAPSGITGAYTLDPVLTGQGTVKQSGQITMTVQWTAAGATNVTLADGQSEVGQASAAARDFLIDKWLWDLSAFGPNPR